MRTKQQGLMEHHLNLLNFLPMMLTNILLVHKPWYFAILFLRWSKERPSQTYL